MAKRQTVLANLAKKAREQSDTVSAPAPPRGDFENRMTTMAEIVDGRRKEVAQILIEPEKCRMWRRHNRDYDKLTPDNCADLIDRIGAEGQQVPAIVRRLEKTDTHEFEVIAGARRHFAVNHLRTELGRTDVLYLVEPRSLDDQVAFSLSDLENRARKDISDYERALDYASALDEFYAGNVSQMAEKLGIKRTTLTTYIAMAKLPDEVVAAYPDYHQLSVRHGSMLVPRLKDEATRTRLVEEAEVIAGIQSNARSVSGRPALDGAEVFKRLYAASNRAASPVKKKPKNEVIKDADGQDILIAETGRKYLTLKIDVTRRGDKKAVLDAVRKAL